MSRIGNKPVKVPDGVKIEIAGGAIKVTGPKGNLSRTFPPEVSIAHDASSKQLTVRRNGESKLARAMHGTARALIQNMVTGVTEGFARAIEVYGTGYSVKVDGANLALNVGYAHPVVLPIPTGVKVNIDVPATKGNEVPAKFSVVGVDKQVVGQFARSIKDSRPPEPYQGKGIRYQGEQIRRKQGKAFAGSAGG
ncbi:MAG: 50S ribosomal protein L6 [Phycisphaerae bacterium]|nr:50S ribosomal protein L6 [Phycisphaerae bacterium]NUQ44662.1 50S ribosomal protein L6 [Phycisphaerae bacterium]